MLIDNNTVNPEKMDTMSIVNLVFSRSPSPPCTYEIALSQEVYNVTLFQLLMNILIFGAKKLYGEFITADQITKQQLDELKEYMTSMGYIIKYNYTYDEGGTPLRVNIWFEPYIHKSICNGKMVLAKP